MLPSWLYVTGEGWGKERGVRDGGVRDRDGGVRGQGWGVRGQGWGVRGQGWGCEGPGMSIRCERSGMGVGVGRATRDGV